MHGNGFTLTPLCVNRLTNKCRWTAIVCTKSCRTSLPFAIWSVDAYLLTVLIFAQLKLGAHGFSYQGRYDYLADFKGATIAIPSKSGSHTNNILKIIRQQHYLQVATTRMDTFLYLAALHACCCIWPSATCLWVRMCLASPKVANLGSCRRKEWAYGSVSLGITEGICNLGDCLSRSKIYALWMLAFWKLGRSPCGSLYLLSAFCIVQQYFFIQVEGLSQMDF